MSNPSLSKIRYQSYTKGENAEVLIAGAQAYTTQATLALFQANAADGEVGIFDANTSALLAANGTLSAPTNPAVTGATTGGSVPAGTAFYKITALNANGETIGSVEVSVTNTGGTSSNQLTWTPVPGATSYRIYRGTATGAQTGYQTSVNPAFLDTSASAGTGGTVPVANTATTGFGAQLAANQKYFIAQQRDGQVKTTTAIRYDSNTTRRVPYLAPVKQVTTISIDTSLYSFVAGDDLEIALIETTPGNEPWPTWAYDAVTGTVVGGTALSTMALALQAIVNRINSLTDLVHKDDVLNGQTPFTASISNSGSVYTITITAGFYGEHFKVALRGPLTALGVVTTTTPFVLGSGFYDHVLALEKEGWIFEGDTTNYPGAGVSPQDFGYPTSYVVNGLTYNIYAIDPRRTSSEPNAVNERVHYAHLYIITPVPVGGNAAARAASSPDYAIGTILGFSLTA